MTIFQKGSKWRQTRLGLSAFVLGELGLFALFASLAINSGSLWQYTFGFVVLVNAAADAARLIRLCVRKIRHG